MKIRHTLITKAPVWLSAALIFGLSSLGTAHSAQQHLNRPRAQITSAAPEQCNECHAHQGLRLPAFSSITRRGIPHDRQH